MRIATVAALIATFVSPAFADEDWFPPVADGTVEAECGACHLAFSPAMLPQRSWRSLMAGLDDHFGEDASVDAGTAARIENYLTANAADSSNRYGDVLRGLSPDVTPLRISSLPWWVHEHAEEVRPSAYDRPEIGSKANCVACHRSAARGSFDDD